MTSTLSLKERILKEMKQKQSFMQSNDDIKNSCRVAFDGLDKIKINHAVAEKQLRSIRGK